MVTCGLQSCFVDVELWVVRVLPDVQWFDVRDEELPSEEDGDFAGSG
jgi:hypothetical protein